MSFFKESNEDLDPAILEFIADRQDEGLTEDEIAKLLVEGGVNPLDYQPIPIEDQRPVAVGDVARWMSGSEQSTPKWGSRRPPLRQPTLHDPSGAMPGADDLAETMEETITDNTDPMYDVGLEAEPGGTDPEIGLAPKDEESAPGPGMFQRMKSMLGDESLAQAMMATGFGILGAQNTYGDTGQAIGQGGMEAMKHLERSTRRKDIDLFKRDQLKSVEGRDKSAKKLAADRLASEDANRNELRSQDRAANILRMVESGNAEGANAALNADPAVRAQLGLPQGINLTNKPLSLSDLQGLTFGRLSSGEQKTVVMGEKGKGPSPTEQEGVILSKYLANGWNALTSEEQTILQTRLRDPDLADAIRDVNNPTTGPYWALEPEQRRAMAARIAEDMRTARRDVKKESKAEVGAGGLSKREERNKAAANRVVQALGLR